MPYISQQASQFLPDHAVAFAGAGFQSGAIKDCNVAAAVTDEAGALQISGGLRNAFPSHAEHAGDQFLRHDQFT